MSDALGGVDYSQYQNWQRVVAPTGATYYVVPGTGYVYDPFLSAQKGRPVLWTNPQPAVEQQQHQQDLQNRQQRNQDRASSPIGQAIPVVGAATGTVAGAYLIDQLKKPQAIGVTPQGNVVMSDGSIVTQGAKGAAAGAPTAPAAPAGAAPTAPASSTQAAFVQGATGQTAPAPAPAEQPTTTLPAGSTQGPNGEVLNPDGTMTNSTGQIVGRWAQGVGGAIMIYQGYNRYQSGDRVGGAAEAGAGAALAGNAAGYVSAGVAAPVVGAYGAYELGDMAYHAGDMHTSDTGGNTVRGAAAGAALGGAIGSVVPGVGTAIGAAVGGVVGGAYGAIQGLSASSKGARQVVRDKYRDWVLKNNVPLFDKNYQGTLADGSTYDFGKDKFGFGKGEGDIDLEDPVNAKAAAYGNILAAVQGGSGKAGEAIATQFLGAATSNANGNLGTVQANYRHFLNQIGMNQQQAQANLDQALKDKHITGDQYNIYSHDLNELYSAPASPGGAPTVSSAPPPGVAPARSSTLSPGISLGGQRLNFYPKSNAQQIGKQLAQRMNARR